MWTVAAASQRQLIAASEKMAKLAEQLEQLQSESLDKAPVDDAEMIQQLINARVAHAVWYTDTGYSPIKRKPFCVHVDK